MAYKPFKNHLAEGMAQTTKNVSGIKAPLQNTNSSNNMLGQNVPNSQIQPYQQKNFGGANVPDLGNKQSGSVGSNTGNNEGGIHGGPGYQPGSDMIGAGEGGSGSGMDTGDLAGIYGESNWHNVYELGMGPGSNMGFQGRPEGWEPPVYDPYEPTGDEDYNQPSWGYVNDFFNTLSGNSMESWIDANYGNDWVWNNPNSGQQASSGTNWNYNNTWDYNHVFNLVHNYVQQNEGQFNYENTSSPGDYASLVDYLFNQGWLYSEHHANTTGDASTGTQSQGYDILSNLLENTKAKLYSGASEENKRKSQGFANYGIMVGE